MILLLIAATLFCAWRRTRVENFETNHLAHIILPPQNTALHIDIAADGKKLCVFTGPNVFMYKAPYNDAAPYLTISEDYISSMDLSRDGSTIILALAQGQGNKVKIQMYDSDTGKLKSYFTVEESQFSAYSSRVRSNDNGDTLAVFTDTKDSGNILIYEKEGDDWVVKLHSRINNDRLPRIGISGNGQTVIYVGEATSKIQVFKKVDGKWVADGEIDLINPGPSMVSDDGETIVAASRAFSSLVSNIAVYKRNGLADWKKDAIIEAKVGEFVSVDVTANGNTVAGTTDTATYFYNKQGDEWILDVKLPISPQGSVNSTVLTPHAHTFAMSDSSPNGNIFIYT